MSSFVYDGTGLPFPKANARPPAGPPVNFVEAADWNALCQAALDLRNALLSGRFFGFERQQSPSGAGDRIWLGQDGRLRLGLSDGTELQFQPLLLGTGQTSDASGQTLVLLSLALPADGGGALVSVRVIGIRSDGQAARGVVLHGLFLRQGGQAVQVGSTNQIPFLGDPAASATLGVSGASVQVVVTGPSGAVYNWRAELSATSL